MVNFIFVYRFTLSGGGLESLANSLAKLFRAEEWNERTLPNHAISLSCAETEIAVSRALSN